jgi:hypothetical protein
MGCAKRTRIAAPALAVAAAMNLPSPATATTLEPAASRPVVLAQAMVPPTGMMDAQSHADE